MMAICDCCGLPNEVKQLAFNGDYLCEECFAHAKKILRGLK